MSATKQSSNKGPEHGNTSRASTTTEMDLNDSMYKHTLSSHEKELYKLTNSTTDQEDLKFSPDNPYILGPNNQINQERTQDTQDQLEIEVEHENGQEDPNYNSDEMIKTESVATIEDNDQPAQKMLYSQAVKQSRKEQYNTAKWHPDRVINILESGEELSELLKYKYATKPTSLDIPEAIGIKLYYKDRVFFRTFT
ncbi:3023_t:CDS:2 [Gigaspora margarita]|uniref:3023_t:CDS:1 n=1 Tax=Gigaspora margarita TaxID=4874 RepID=A0ABN7UJD2_GIGMA|nr:3023_t:CDS:2 [Gigaspora margarita]